MCLFILKLLIKFSNLEENNKIYPKNAFNLFFIFFRKLVSINLGLILTEGSGKDLLLVQEDRMRVKEMNRNGITDIRKIQTSYNI